MKYLGADGGAPGWVLAKVEAKARDHTTCSAHVTWAGLGLRLGVGVGVGLGCRV